jgi:hypothetical protein
MARTSSTPAPDFENSIPSTEAQNLAGLAGDTIEVTATAPRSGTIRAQSAAPISRRRRRRESMNLDSGLSNDDVSAQLQHI